MLSNWLTRFHFKSIHSILKSLRMCNIYHPSIQTLFSFDQHQPSKLSSQDENPILKWWFVALIQIGKFANHKMIYRFQFAAYIENCICFSIYFYIVFTSPISDHRGLMMSRWPSRCRCSKLCCIWKKGVKIIFNIKWRLGKESVGRGRSTDIQIVLFICGQLCKIIVVVIVWSIRQT